MAGVGERQNEAIHPSFDRSISIDFKGAKITSDSGLIDLSPACPMGDCMVLRALGLSKKFFRAEYDPKMRLGCIAHNLMHYYSECLSRLFPDSLGRNRPMLKDIIENPKSLFGILRKRCVQAIQLFCTLNTCLATIRIFRLSNIKCIKHHRRTIALKYLRTYLGASFSCTSRGAILVNHYTFLNNYMLDDFCANIITNKIVLWEQIIMLNLFTIHLELPNHDLEGDVNLVFRMNGIGIYYLSFTIVPGKILDIASEHVIFIARVQGVHKYYGLIMQCTKDFNYIAPSEVLVTAIQAIATALNIDSIAGITANEQLSKGCGDFIFDYDRLWIKVGGYKINKQAFHIPTQPYERPLDMIKTNHRSRKRHKRQLKRDIYNHIIQAFEQKCCKKPIGIGISS